MALNQDMALMLQYLFVGLLAAVLLVTWGDLGGLAAVRKIPGVARFFLGLLALIGMVGVLGGPQYFTKPSMVVAGKTEGAGSKTGGTPIDLNWSLRSVADGKDINLSSFKGKVLFVNIWATWCPPCVGEMPSIETLHSHFADRDDVAFVLASVDDTADMAKSFAVKKSMKAPIYHARGSMPADLRTQGIPATFIVAKDGTLRYKHVGGWDWSGERGKIEALIAEKSSAAPGEAKQ
jgi:thiol-disulfide isomerase/thioredoxin